MKIYKSTGEMKDILNNFEFNFQSILFFISFVADIDLYEVMTFMGKEGNDVY